MMLDSRIFLGVSFNRFEMFFFRCVVMNFGIIWLICCFKVFFIIYEKDGKLSWLIFNVFFMDFLMVLWMLLKDS